MTPLPTRQPLAPKVYHTFNVPQTPPALLAGIPYLTQINLSTPYQAAEIDAAVAAPGDIFLDTEIAVENGDVAAWGANLHAAVQAVHARAPHKRLGVFSLPMGANANPYWQILYQPIVDAARQARAAGHLNGLAWASLCLYCDCGTLNDHTRTVHWYNGLLSQAAALKAAGLPVMGFLSPYDASGAAVPVQLFGEACILARGLLDMGTVEAVTLWAWRQQPWDGDAAQQIGQFRQYLGVGHTSGWRVPNNDTWAQAVFHLPPFSEPPPSATARKPH